MGVYCVGKEDVQHSLLRILLQAGSSSSKGISSALVSQTAVVCLTLPLTGSAVSNGMPMAKPDLKINIPGAMAPELPYSQRSQAGGAAGAEASRAQKVREGCAGYSSGCCIVLPGSLAAVKPGGGGVQSVARCAVKARVAPAFCSHILTQSASLFYTSEPCSEGSTIVVQHLTDDVLLLASHTPPKIPPPTATTITTG